MLLPVARRLALCALAATACTDGEAEDPLDKMPPHFPPKKTRPERPPEDLVTFNSSVAITGELAVHSRVHFIKDDDPSTGPELFWEGNRGAWVSGIDVANNGGSRDLVLAGKFNWPRPNDVADLLYIAHHGEFAPTIGAGVTPPDRSHRLQVSGQDNEPAMGALLLRRTPAQSGHLLTAIDDAGTPRWWLDANYWLQGRNPGSGASFSIKADPDNERALAMSRSDGAAIYGYQYDGDALHIRYLTNGRNNLTLRTNGTPDFPNGLSTRGLRVDTGAVPVTPNSTCEKGQLVFDTDHIYVCVAPNSWKRSALASW